MFKVIVNDLIDMMLDNQTRYVAHGCNCQCTMRSGFAAAISKYFPEAVEADAKTVCGDSNKMGGFTTAFISRNNVQIFNLYTQFRFGKPSDNNFEIEAYRLALTQAISQIPNDTVLFIPAIGAGLGGGDIHQIVEVTKAVIEISNHSVTMVIQPTSPLLSELSNYLES